MTERGTYPECGFSVVIMGLRPSFFLFLLMAAALADAVAAAALVIFAVVPIAVVAAAGLAVLAVSLPTFAEPLAASMVEGGTASCVCGPLCVKAGRATATSIPVVSLSVWSPPFIMRIV